MAVSVGQTDTAAAPRLIFITCTLLTDVSFSLSHFFSSVSLSAGREGQGEPPTLALWKPAGGCHVPRGVWQRREDVLRV